MKRFVTYIYEYERGIRGKNIGFIRTDIRDEECRMELHIRGLDRFKGKGSVYLIVGKDSPEGISAGDILFSQGVGNFKITCPQNKLGKSGYTIDDLQALAIRYNGGKLLIGIFAEHPSEAILRGNFVIPETVPVPLPQPSPEKEYTVGTIPAPAAQPAPMLNPEPETTPAPAPPSVAETSSEPEPQLTSSAIENKRNSGEEQPKKSRVSYQKIEITDIRKMLPKRNWYLCNNSFLVHGFFSYHFLMLKTVETSDGTQRFLGVPGIYEQPERMMALLFGFPEFEPGRISADGGTSVSDTQPDSAMNANGVFGYWMCAVSED